MRDRLQQYLDHAVNSLGPRYRFGPPWSKRGREGFRLFVHPENVENRSQNFKRRGERPPQQVRRRRRRKRGCCLGHAASALRLAAGVHSIPNYFVNVPFPQKKTVNKRPAAAAAAVASNKNNKHLLWSQIASLSLSPVRRVPRP